ncbi:MAG: sulfotransferase, partial [Flavobacteriaceae bacterium]
MTATIALSNAVLSDEEELQKQKKLILALKAMLISLALTLVLIAFIIITTCAPIVLYAKIKDIPYENLDFGSVRFVLFLSLGSILPFVLKKKKENEDYSEASKLLHKLILNNYFLSKFLFSIDKKFKKNKNLKQNSNFLIVSGLARAGTTSLTDQIFKAGKFSSLDYSNMPLLLAPNLWKKLYNPKKSKLKERKHGDKMLFGLNTIEALEEYFFKVFLNDSFISEEYLNRHEISQEVYDNYLKYQTNIRQVSDSMYLSKNNNLILRYHSLRKLNNDFKVIFLFRKPEEHAYSLLNQHLRFTEMQNNNDFVLSYMNWLGHHEFGNNQKIFKLTEETPNIKFDKNSLNYWLKIWLNYYRYILNINDNNFMLLEYADYLKYPKEVLRAVEKDLKTQFNFSHIKPFINKKT